MPIPISNYVDITSGIGAGNNVPTRNLGALVVTNNPLCPTGQLISFTSAAAVGDFFGTSSEEYNRASYYFGWVSKSITTPQKISFWFWNADMATGSLIYGATPPDTLQQFQAITTGDFTLTLGGYTQHLTGLNFAAATSLGAASSSVKSILQTAIQAISAGGAAWTGATVTYNATGVNGEGAQFNLTSGALGADTVTVAVGTITDAAGPLGWLTGATLSNGTAAQNITTNLDSLINITNNFGSFCFEYGNYERASFTASILTTGIMSVAAVTAGSLAIGDLITGAGVTSGTEITGLGTGSGAAGTYTISPLPGSNISAEAMTAAMAVQLTEIVSAANWNNSLTPNLMFMFSVGVSAANASSWASSLSEIGGCTATLLSPLSTAYPEMDPMMILAATDYTQRNAVQNYMFQQFADNPSVTTQTLQQLYDGLLINYYGQTETAGQNLSFYQRGVMFGISTDPSDQNVYANEIWFKDAIGAALMTLLLSLTEIPANSTGQAQVTSAIQTVIQQALLNGTISVGKTLSTAQQLYITQATGSNTAWQQVASSGYWLGVEVESYVTDGVTEYKIVYTLIYAKNDVIRLITGSDILI